MGGTLFCDDGCKNVRIDVGGLAVNGANRFRILGAWYEDGCRLAFILLNMLIEFGINAAASGDAKGAIMGDATLAICV